VDRGNAINVPEAAQLILWRSGGCVFEREMLLASGLKRSTLPACHRRSCSARRRLDSAKPWRLKPDEVVGIRQPPCDDSWIGFVYSSGGHFIRKNTITIAKRLRQASHAAPKNVVLYQMVPTSRF
jgi:hypothetical protein